MQKHPVFINPKVYHLNINEHLNQTQPDLHGTVWLHILYLVLEKETDI